MNTVHQKALGLQKLPVVILHGWKLRGEKYNALVKLIEDSGHKVLAPDMPGFGSVTLTKPSMMLGDYVQFVNELVKKHKFEKIMLIGHSFGGRVAIKYTVEHPDTVSLLVLTGVPVIRNMSTKKKIARSVAFLGNLPLRLMPIKTQRFAKKLLYYSLGEWDYYKAGELRDVFKNIITEDLVQYVTQIKNSTLLLWGAQDAFTPVKDVKKITKLMPQAKVVIFPGIGHGLPYTEPQLMYKALEPYL